MDPKLTIPLKDQIRVVLRAVERGDLDRFKEWRNDYAEFCREWRPLSDEDQNAWFHRISGADRNTHVMFTVCSKDEPKLPVGCCGLTYVDWVRRRGEISIYIGGTRALHEGLGRDTLATLIDFGFDEMGLHRQTAEVFAFNDRGLRLFHGFGFVEEGRLREHHYTKGVWCDSILFGLLRSEWRQ